MACAKPVIGSRVGGIPESVDDGRTGRLVEPGDPEGLAGAILELIDEPGKRQDWASAARQRAEREFSYSKTVRETTETYLALLHGEALAVTGSGP